MDGMEEGAAVPYIWRPARGDTVPGCGPRVGWVSPLTVWERPNQMKGLRRPCG